MSPCKNCIYYRREENDKYPRCYFKPKAPGDIPPCEEDDFEEYYDEEDYDMEEDEFQLNDIEKYLTEACRY